MSHTLRHSADKNAANGYDSVSKNPRINQGSIFERSLATAMHAGKRRMILVVKNVKFCHRVQLRMEHAPNL